MNIQREGLLEKQTKIMIKKTGIGDPPTPEQHSILSIQ